MRARSVICLIILTLLSFTAVGCGLDPMETLGAQVVSPDLPARKEAVLQLANLRDARAISELVDALQSDEEIADVVAVALVKKGRPLVPRVRENPVVKQVAEAMTAAYVLPNLRARAAWTLGEIGDRRAIPDLQLMATAPPPLGPEATAALEKLGFKAEGRPFDLAPGLLEGRLEALPAAPPLLEPALEEE